MQKATKKDAKNSSSPHTSNNPKSALLIQEPSDPLPSFQIPAKAGGKTLSALIDTGACQNYLSSALIKELDMPTIRIDTPSKV